MTYPTPRDSNEGTSMIYENASVKINELSWPSEQVWLAVRLSF